MAQARESLLRLFSLFLLFFGLAVINASLLYTDNKSIFFLDEQSFTRNKRPNTSVIYTNLTNSYAIDFDYSEQLIFWSDQSEDVITSLRLSDKKTFTIGISNPQSPEKFAVDWVGKKLYWADTGLNRIEVSNYNGSQRSVLISKDLESLWSIALVPEDGFLFWADCFPPGKIERSSMDGDPGSRTVILEDRDSCFSGLTVDYAAKRLYWFTIPVKTDLNHVSRIESSDFFGNQRISHLCSSSRFPVPFRLFMTLIGDTVFWSDNSSKDIHSCNLKSGAVGHANLPKYRNSKKEEQHAPHGLKWFSAAAQPGNHSHCSHNNGNCSHLCLLSSIGPRFISCACPSGMKLHPDNQTCAVHEKLLLIARSSDLRKIALDSPDTSTIVLRKTKHATLIDYDPVEMMVYWADDHKDGRSIRKAPFNGKSNDTVVVVNREVVCLEAIVIDPVARNIYWTECEMARVVVARLDGSSRKVLVEEDLEKPRALAVHQEAGYMFWSDWGQKPKIERALLDGSERTAIITTKIRWPNGLAIDTKESKLYFGDGFEHTVEWCRFDGSQRTLLIKDKAMYIFGFTLLDDWIYFSDRQKRLIKGINTRNSSIQKDLVDGISNQLPDWMGIKAVNFNTSENFALQNSCGASNGGCSHFCFSRPDKDYTCACPRGYHLVDKFNCVLEKVSFFFLQRHEIQQQLANSSLISQVSGIQSAKSFDLDVSRNTVYWIDSKSRAIFRLVLHKGQPEQIFKLPSDSNSKPEDLAIDWLSEQLYWVDSASRKIEVGKSDGKYRKVIYQFLDGQKPKSVVVDSAFGYLFVSSFDRQWVARIDCFFLDGSKAFKSPVIHNARNVHSLTIDYDDHRLYWLDENRNIDSCKYDGSNRKFIKGNSERFSSISVFQSYIYLLDPNQKIIRIINKTKGFDVTSNLTISVSSNTSDIIVSHPLAQTGWNCCANRNGGCEQLCFYKLQFKNGHKQYDTCDMEDSSVVCGCKVNYRLDGSDTRKCLGPDSFLLYSHKSALITRFLFDQKSADFSETENFFFANNATNIQTISYDPYDDQLYFIDSSSSIQRKRFNDTTSKIIIQKQRTEEFYDLVIDPYSRILYWTSGATGRSNSINATRLIGEPTTIGTIYWNSGDYPRFLAMHHRKNFLFWTNDQPKFEPRFSAQSYQISCITLNPLPVSKVIIWRPEPITAITVEQDLNYLIFSSSSEIFYSDFEGSSIKLLYQEETAFYPFSMAVHSKYLFWMTADKHHDGSIDKISLDLNMGRRKQRVYEKIGELSKLISVTPMRTSLAHLNCADENGGCSHICLIVEGIGGTETQCACPLNLILSGKNCTEPVTCAANQFRCLDGLRCTSDISRRCDETVTENPSERAIDLPVVPSRSNPNYIWALVCAIFIFILVIFIIICQFKRCQKDPEKLTISERRAYYVPDQLHLTQLPEESSLFPAAATAANGLVGYHIDGPGHGNLNIIYPTATTNPPPSPATLRSQSIYSTTNSRAPVYPLPNRKPRKQRPKKSLKPRSDLTSISGTGRTGPPPSLCGSDYDYLSPTSTTSVKYEHLYENEHHLATTVYIPPAPTPRHYFSDPSCPPSPGTERSFCTVQNLVPPHPSPVPEGDF